MIDTMFNEKKFTDTNFSNGILAGLSELRNNGKFFDVVVNVENKQFSCHRVVLAAASNYFRSMFGGMMKESSTDNVRLFHVDAASVESLIDFCYTGDVLITKENVIDLLKASDLLQFVSIRDACCNFLTNHLLTSNCLNILYFAEAMSCFDLATNAISFIAKNIGEVTNSPDFLKIDSENIKKLLLHRDLNIQKEECAYEMLIYWLKADFKYRKNEFCHLLQYIRLPFIRRIYLLSKIETNPIVRNSPLCLDLVKETRMFHTCMLDKQDNASLRLQPRPSTGIAELLITVGGCNKNWDNINSVSSFNPINQVRRDLNRFTGNLKGAYSTVALGNDIYVTGGSDGSSTSNKAWRYNSQVNEWSAIASMLNTRDYHGSVVLNSFIYVVGAEGCEYYDFMSNLWKPISHMPKLVSNCSVASCNGKIYCIGSTSNPDEMILQAYSPATDTWDILPVLFPSISFVPRITSLKGLLYFIQEESREVLTFDPLGKHWIGSTSPMQHLHLGGGVTIFGGKIVVSGGFDESYGLTGIIEAYDNTSNTWEVIGNMPRPLVWHGCASIYRFVQSPTGQMVTNDPNLHDLSDYLSC